MDDIRRAQQFAQMILHPSGEQRPDRAQVLERLAGQMAFDSAQFSSWEREAFVCHNGQTAIYGEYFPIRNAVGCAVLAHGFGQERHIMIPQQALFRELKFDTILFDQRAFGESTESCCTFGVKEARDTACVVDWARRKCGGDARIVLLGVSMGAAASMNALRYTDNIDYLIEDCGFADIEHTIDSLYASMNAGAHNAHAAEVFLCAMAGLGLDMRAEKPIGAVSSSRVPVCIIHGTADSTIGAEHARRLYQVCRAPRSRLELFEGKEHALCVTDTGRYKKILQEFLER